MGRLYQECVMQLPVSSVAPFLFAPPESHLQCASLLLLDAFFIDESPMNKINMKTKFYSLVLEICLITSLPSRAMY